VAGKIHRLAAQILQQERHAAKRAVWQAIGNRLARHAFLHLHHGIEGGIARLDRREGGIQQFGRADLAAGHPLGQVCCVLCPKITDHHRLLFCLSLTGRAGQSNPERAAAGVGFHPRCQIATFAPRDATWWPKRRLTGADLALSRGHLRLRLAPDEKGMWCNSTAAPATVSGER
jgi:hypothetical protein